MYLSVPKIGRQYTPLVLLPFSDSMPEQEIGEFQFQMDIWT